MVISMKRYCSYCKRHYPYNPSAGDLGLICPHCGDTYISEIVAAIKRLLERIFG